MSTVTWNAKNCAMLHRILEFVGGVRARAGTQGQVLYSSGTHYLDFETRALSGRKVTRQAGSACCWAPGICLSPQCWDYSVDHYVQFFSFLKNLVHKHCAYITPTPSSSWSLYYVMCTYIHVYMYKQHTKSVYCCSYSHASRADLS